MSETTPWEKEELYDVISALNAVIRELTKEIVELQGILISMNYKMEDLQ
jgi:hypothetical protein